MKRFSLFAAVVAGLFLSTSGFAASTLFDQSLVAPGFYNGTGGANNGFAVTTDNGIEVGLRAMLRQNPADISNGTNTYNVPLGFQTNTTSGGNGANPGRAAWNMDFSVNLQPGNVNGPSSGLTIADIHSVLTYTGGPGSPVSGNPLTFFNDSSAWGPAGEHDTGPGSALPTDWAFQNSENALFLGLNPLLNQTYTFQLDVFKNSDGSLLASDYIVVNAGEGGGTPRAVPVPAAAWAGLSTMGGLGVVGFMKKRRRAQKA